MKQVHPQSPEALATEISQGRWLIIADTLESDRLDQQPSFRWLGFLLLVVANKRQIAIFTLLGTAVTLVVSLLLPNRYTATTQLLPPQLNQSSAGALLGQLGDLASLAGRDLVRNPSALFVALLRSRSVADPVIAQMDLMSVYGTRQLSICRKKLEKNTQIEATKEGIIVLQVDDREPERATRIANAYVSELVRLNERLAVGEAARRRLFFEQQVKAAHEQLGEAEDALRSLQQTTGMVQLDAQAKMAIESAAMLRANVAYKKAQLERIHTYATEQNPDYVRVKTELDALQRQLREIGKSADRSGGLDFSATSLPATGLEYVRRLREVKYRETVFEMLSKQLELARVDEAKEGSLIQVIDAAQVPDGKSGPARAWITVAGSLLALLISLVWIGARDALARARGNAETNRQLERLKSSFPLFPTKHGS